MENDKFTLITEEGEKVECDILFTFDSDDTGKSYVVYTDNSKDIYGNICIYASTYIQTDEKISLEPIETKEEWDTVESVLSSLQNDIRKDLKVDEDL